MNLSSARRRPGKKTIIGVLLAIAASLLAIGAILAPSSGADFTASDNGRVGVSTATLSLNLSDDGGHSGTFDLAYGNMKPGDSVTRTIYVKNTGTIPASAKLGQPVTGLTIPSGLSTADFAKLTISVNGSSPVSVTSAPTSFSLGNVAAGHTLAVHLTIGLRPTAGNEWQGKTIAGNGTVTLNQA